MALPEFSLSSLNLRGQFSSQNQGEHNRYSAGGVVSFTSNDSASLWKRHDVDLDLQIKKLAYEISTLHLLQPSTSLQQLDALAQSI